MRWATASGRHPRRLLRLASVGLLVVAACQHRQEAPPAPRPLGLRRLLPAMGTAQPLRLEGETRPALMLRPGERRSAAVETREGDQLMFAVGAGPGGPPRGRMRVQVQANGRTIFDGAFPLARGARWWPSTVPLPASPRLNLDLAVSWQGPPEMTAPAEPWIAVAAPRVHAAGDRPGRVLVWISIDTLRADHLGTWGYARPTSPALDARLRDFVVFDDAMATASWTLPSLASQFTARYPTAHGAVNPRAAVSPASRTVFEALSDAGFTVLGVTGNFYISTEYGLWRGFDALWHTQGPAISIDAYARRALSERGSGDLALFLHYMDPHAPYAPPPPFDRRFDPGYRGAIDGHNYATLRRTGPADLEHVKALYDGEIASTDAHVEGTLRALAEEGLLQNAVIVLSADHGEEFLEHGSWNHGGTLFREVLHVPLALRVPGVSARRVGAPVSLVDLAPTVLDALGVAPPRTFMGQSLLPVLRGQPPRPGPLFAETELTAGHDRVIAVRDGPRAYVLHQGGSNAGKETAALYDVRADPGETRDVSGAGDDAAPFHAAALAYLDRQRAAAGPARAAAIEGETAEALKALGYID